MQDKLRPLVELQKVDLDIAALRKSAEVYPKQMSELERELATVRSALETDRAGLMEVERQKRALEQTIVDEKDKVKKWEGRLTEQRAPREYSALAREIDIAKKSQLSMAEQLTEMGKTVVTTRDQVKTKEQATIGQSDETSGKLRELKEKASALDSQMKELEEKRASVAKHVDVTLLRRYDVVRKKRMPALVSVISGTCQGCNMNIPPQMYNTLAVSLAMDLCPYCNRLISAQAAFDAAQK